jgi:hypothetical protein
MSDEKKVIPFPHKEGMGTPPDDPLMSLPGPPSESWFFCGRCKVDVRVEDVPWSSRLLGCAKCAPENKGAVMHMAALGTRALAFGEDLDKLLIAARAVIRRDRGGASLEADIRELRRVIELFDRNEGVVPVFGNWKREQVHAGAALPSAAAEPK